jgi:type I restriction enzyme, S subunit
MKDWRIVSLNDLGEVNRGKSRHRPRNDTSLYGGPYPFIQTGDVKAARGLVKSYSQTYSEKGLAQSRLWPKGTMAITIAANIAETAILGFPACFPDSVVGFIPDERRANVRFVEYLFRHLRRQIQSENVGTGSVQDNINLQTIGALELLVPPKEEQDRIAAALGTLDDKIELNRRMSATLEEMARALYRSWFVDFDPVHARALGQSPAHMAPTTAALFPDSFGPDGLPKGWKAGCLGDIAKNVRQQVEPDKIDADTPYIGLEHMPRRSIALSDWGGAGQVGSAKSAMKKGQFLFGKLRPYFHKVGVVPTDGICSTDILVVDAKTDDWRELVLAIISSEAFVEHANASSSGTRMPRSNWKDMSRYDVAVPPVSIARSFSDVVRPMTEKMIIGIHESRTLATLRDTLLPRLMSGDLRIREAEKQVEEIV